MPEKLLKANNIKTMNIEDNNIDNNKITPSSDGYGETPSSTNGDRETTKATVDIKESAMKVEPVIATTPPANANTQCTCGKNAEGECDCKTGNSCATTSTNSDKCDNCAKSATKKCCCSGKNKLEVYDWLEDMPESLKSTQMIEVQFKNTRKGYYLNSNNLDLNKGDIVAVEATPGHDIGEVTMTGKLVLLQMKKANYRTPQGEQKRVYRIAKPTDIEKAQIARSLEHKTMLRAREIAEELGLHMKISDVEYQGDGNKAIFYYIADERVDFRQLIKVYAEKFKVKIEMKQIGARQEAGRVGGIGPCGRELCCSASVSSFVSVSTSAARFQDISLNPQKLAGQCGKLKCCLNYEVDVYVEAQRKLPSREVVLETKDASYFHFKTDILSGMMTYSTDKRLASNLVTIDKDRVFDIIRMNKHGERPLNLMREGERNEEGPVASLDVLSQESITRFDNLKKKRKKQNRVRPQNGENRKPESENGNGNGNTATEPNEGRERNAGNRNRGGNRNNKSGDNQPRRENRRPNNNQQNNPIRSEAQKTDGERTSPPKKTFKRNRPPHSNANENNNGKPSISPES
ncbi:cell fate regulator YaaT (PSP1 superfamily) [Dysgonomonas sp. PH5-45]|uniref:PSP1 domain-containing protein n=1 Tax=unclassified Dysgonomonas TaxID=2630389 RepID=UPI002472FAAC|nr:MULTISPECIES: regulatory iron-sulfur-containing complex subunit RicT [unclassified Dysgonomonas]MDH6354342.1 cell fate regulator YaaT (PSP1 superfamily) [Dysgonomonas sp. PH5-45]MDH6387242.1 cell fate regulator YaaT (PSP1 superfamily) [Dysgonomonas sp. PH5-37]